VIHNRAFTAFEALLATAILALITASVSSALMAGRMQSKLARDTMHASMLAHALLDEVTRLPATDSAGGGAGTRTRFTFTCASDYNDYRDGPGNIQDLAQNPYPAAYQPYTRSVSVIQQTYSPTGWGVSLRPYLVTVTVSRDGQQLISLQRTACHE